MREGKGAAELTEALHRRGETDRMVACNLPGSSVYTGRSERKKEAINGSFNQ
jgi:hypothetical protein